MKKAPFSPLNPPHPAKTFDRWAVKLFSIDNVRRKMVTDGRITKRKP